MCQTGNSKKTPTKKRKAVAEEKPEAAETPIKKVSAKKLEQPPTEEQAPAASPPPRKKKAAKAAPPAAAPAAEEQAPAASPPPRKKKAAKAAPAAEEQAPAAEEEDKREPAAPPTPKKKQAAKAKSRATSTAADAPQTATESAASPPKKNAAKRLRDAAAAEAAPPAKKAKKPTKKDGTSAPHGEPRVLSSDEFFEKHDIKVLEGDIDTPFQSFSDVEAATSTLIVSQFTKAGFSSPSPIQSICWPAALKGSDLIAIAKTGSGKTLGFLIPAFSMILPLIPTDPRQPRVQPGQPPAAIVLSPTRELALQIHEESMKFGNPAKIVSVAVFGGVPSGKQIRELRRGCHIVVATPGRIIDLLDLDNPPVTNLDSIRYAVLDEADQMLDMGFEPSITKIMGMLPTQHQTLMFTATWPKAIQKIARNFLVDPVHVQVGGDGLRANADVFQEFVQVTGDRERESGLVKALTTHAKDNESVLVFVNKKTDCDNVVRVVKRSGLSVTAIHGDLEQDARLRALKLFRDEKVRVVVATDVAARGLDIDGVGLVINYEFPPSGCEVWVHRVGRTGRAGRKGKAVTFFSEYGTERKHAVDLLELLKTSKTPIPDFLPPLAAVVGPENERIQSKKEFFRGVNKKGSGKGGKGGGKGGKSGKGSKGSKGGKKGSAW